MQIFFASGGQGGRFLKKLPPLDPPAKTFDYGENFKKIIPRESNRI
jgi:hypothetical protein